MFKKLLVTILTFILSLSALFITGCKTKTDLNIYVVDGAPLVSVSNLIESSEINGAKVNVNVVSGVDALTGAIARGDANVAVCPINVAAKLYNGGVDVKLLSVNVFGVLKILSNEEVDIFDLKGNTVYNIGAGGTPDVTLKHLLTANGIEYTVNKETADSDKVNLKYVSSAEELIPLLKTGVAKFGVLGEPAVSKAVKVAGVKPIISLTDEWAKFYSEKYTQAGVIVSANLVKTNPKLVKALYNELKNSKNYAITNANSLKNVLISAGSSLQIDFTVDVINECNLGIENAFAIKKDVENYLTIIGDKLPNNNFYIDNEKL